MQESREGIMGEVGGGGRRGSGLWGVVPIQKSVCVLQVRQTSWVVSVWFQDVGG